MFRKFTTALIALLLIVLITPTARAQVELSGRGTFGNIMQNAAVATGNGNVMDVRSYTTFGFDVTIATTATVTFEGLATSGSGTGQGTWVAFACKNVTTSAIATTATATGFFEGSGTFQQVRARISAWTSGAVTVYGSAKTMPLSNSVATLAGLTGAAASGAALSGNPVLVAGGNGTNAYTLLTGTDGRISANIAQINGVTALMGNGVTGTGSQRVTVASDNTAFPVTTSGTVADGAAKSNGVQISGQDGTNVESVWTGSAANVAAANPGLHTLQVTGPGEWAVNHVPSTATQATISKAAGAAGVRHVCTSITATVSLGATAQTPLLVYLRDGATGAGTILWAATVAGIADGEGMVTISGLHVFGTAATAMTLEFAVAGVTASQEVVSMTGYDTI